MHVNYFLDDGEAQARSGFLGRKVWLEYFWNVFLGYAAPGIRYVEPYNPSSGVIFTFSVPPVASIDWTALMKRLLKTDRRNSGSPMTSVTSSCSTSAILMCFSSASASIMRRESSTTRRE